MDITFVLKIAVIGIIVAILNQVLSKAGRDDYAMLTAIAGIVVILMMLIPQIESLYSAIKSVFEL
ncbi:MAG: stage III sporulation protein AC [Oscillospiraceae bacterium]|nr:stage III sporulation protein AC [Oscillospiraceae bacterium]